MRNMDTLERRHEKSRGGGDMDVENYGNTKMGIMISDDVLKRIREERQLMNLILEREKK